MSRRIARPVAVASACSTAGASRRRLLCRRAGKVPAWLVFALLNVVTLGVLAAVVVQLWNRPNVAPDATAGQSRLNPAAPIGANSVNAASPAAVAGESTLAADTAASAHKPLATIDTRSPAGRVVEQVRNGVVRVSAVDAKGQETSFGSGFVIDATGLVATNRHVIENAHKAFVKFRDGTRINVLGVRALDHDGDLAILELEGAPGNMQVLKLAGDEPPAEADAVIAIGHPKGIEFTTSTGIVSAVRSTSDLPREFRENMTAPESNVWIQTTAAISGGNSGGPLLNEAGEVVGINTWKASGENLSFAAHVRHLRALRDKLQATATPLAELSTPDTQLAKLIEDFSTNHQWWNSRMQTATSDEERAELEKSPHPAAECTRQLLALAARHRGKPAAFKALSYACRVAATDTVEGPNAPLAQAVERVLAEHADDPGLVNLLSALSTATQPEALDFMRQVAKVCSVNKTKGLACYFLATALEGGGNDSGKHDEEIVALLERCVKEFGEVDLGRQTLGQVAEPRLFSRQFLAVGKPAPEIIGQDQDGEEFKLSDFRGKVVVVDFWADWCPHCVRMYPHERELLKKHAELPFAIVGINSDETERLKEIIERRNITWRNWADGPGGSISAAWRVDGLPTLYVLDHEGIIRATFSGNPGNEALDAAIDKALAALPAATAPGEKPPTDPVAEPSGDTPPADAAPPAETKSADEKSTEEKSADKSATAPDGDQ